VSTEDIVDHGRRIASLERKVSQLYERLGQAEPATAFGGGFGDDPDPPATVAASEDPRVIELIQAGDQIKAIQLYREIAGVGLAEAKDAVDSLKSTYRPTG
jgi:ribosomal protein L7/L12